MEAGRLPEGCDCTLSIYLTSDETGLEMRINLGGLPLLPDFTDRPIEPLKLLDSLGVGDSAIREAAHDWRLMTRAEIKDYRDREDEE